MTRAASNDVKKEGERRVHCHHRDGKCSAGRTAAQRTGQQKRMAERESSDTTFAVALCTARSICVRRSLLLLLLAAYGCCCGCSGVCGSSSRLVRGAEDVITDGPRDVEVAAPSKAHAHTVSLERGRLHTTRWRLHPRSACMLDGVRVPRLDCCCCCCCRCCCCYYSCGCCSCGTDYLPMSACEWCT